MSAPQDLLLPTGIKEETKNPNNARSVLDKLDSGLSILPPFVNP